jgi:uncharacterized protein YcbX
MTRIGKISSIVRYPVKSMAGEAIESGYIGYAGLYGDRVFAFVRDGGRKGFPWFTIRELEELALYKARFVNCAALDAPPDSNVSLKLGVGVAPLYPPESAFDVEVETPTGERVSLREPGLKSHLEQESETTLTLRFSERSLCDCRPISIFATTSLRQLEAEIGVALDRRRFRANLYVEWDSPAPFYENSLIGRTLAIGEQARLVVTERDPRCKIITIDPDTADENPKILRHVVGAHGGLAGVYAAVLHEGIVKAGDTIELA